MYFHGQRYPVGDQRCKVSDRLYPVSDGLYIFGRGQCEELKSATEEFVRACERGDFQSPVKCEWLLPKSRVCDRMLQSGQNDKRA
jgi:hypothetical protein